MSNFSTAAIITKTTEGVLQATLVTLTNHGFAIVERDESSAVLTGPGMNSTSQNPLLGASKVQLKMQGHQLSLDAELGGVDSMRKFLMRFPFILGLSLGLSFGVIGGFAFGRQFGVGFGVPWAQGWTWFFITIGGAMLPVSPWLVLSPLMSNRIRLRTEMALASLVQNAVQLSKPPSLIGH